jgi:hypothetical protein
MTRRKHTTQPTVTGDALARYENTSHSGAVWFDLMPTPADGADGGTVAWPTFDGGGWVDIGQPPKLDFAGAFSISFWSKQDSAAAPAGWERVIARPGSYLGNEVDSTGACAGFLYRNPGSGGGTQSVTTGANALDVWHFVTFVNEGTGSDLVMYVDGAEAARSVGVGGVMTVAAVDLYLGNQPSGVSGYQGVLDTARFYGRALSADEILRDYHAGAPAHT